MVHGVLLIGSMEVEASRDTVVLKERYGFHEREPLDVQRVRQRDFPMELCEWIG